MPGHAQTDIRCRRRRAQGWFLLALGMATLAVGPGRAGEPPAPTAVWTGDETIAIRLKADQIQWWDDAGTTWLVLEDNAEVRQGDVALTARRMVAQVHRSGRSDRSVFRVQLYAEGDVRDPGRPATTFPMIRTLATTEVQIYDEARLPGRRHKLSKPPRGLPILARAFPTTGLDPAPAGNDRPAPADPALVRASATTDPVATDLAAAAPGTSERQPVVATQLSRPVATTVESPAAPTTESPTATTAEDATPALAMPFGSAAPAKSLAVANPAASGAASTSGSSSASAEPNRVDPAVTPAQQAVGSGLARRSRVRRRGGLRGSHAVRPRARAGPRRCGFPFGSRLDDPDARGPPGRQRVAAGSQQRSPGPRR